MTGGNNILRKSRSFRKKHCRTLSQLDEWPSISHSTKVCMSPLLPYHVEAIQEDEVGALTVDFSHLTACRRQQRTARL